MVCASCSCWWCSPPSLACFLCNGDQVSKPARNLRLRQNQIHQRQLTRHREATNQLIRWFRQSRIRLKLLQMEPMQLPVAPPLKSKRQRQSPHRWKPRRPVHWLLLLTQTRAQNPQPQTKPCPIQTPKALKKPVFLITSPAPPWCAPSNISGEPACRRIVNKDCSICTPPQTKAIPVLPSRWLLFIPAASV